MRRCKFCNNVLPDFLPPYERCPSCMSTVSFVPIGYVQTNTHNAIDYEWHYIDKFPKCEMPIDSEIEDIFNLLLAVVCSDEKRYVWEGGYSADEGFYVGDEIQMSFSSENGFTTKYTWGGDDTATVYAWAYKPSPPDLPAKESK